MTVKLNPKALEHAKQLLDENRYMINTVWRTNEPTPDQENRYLETHSLDDYANWYLGIDTDAPADSKARYKFPFGNFQKLHRSGLVAAKQRAAQSDYHEIVEGADELLDIFDRMNAC